MKGAPRGVTLAEVAVALVIVVIGWGALVALQRRVVLTGADARLRDEARWFLLSVADSLEAGPGGTSGRRDTPWGWVQWGPASGGVSFQAWSHRDSLVAELWSGPGTTP